MAKLLVTDEASGPAFTSKGLFTSTATQKTFASAEKTTLPIILKPSDDGVAAASKNVMMSKANET